MRSNLIAISLIGFSLWANTLPSSAQQVKIIDGKVYVGKEIDDYYAKQNAEMQKAHERIMEERRRLGIQDKRDENIAMGERLDRSPLMLGQPSTPPPR